MILKNQVEWALHCCTILSGVPDGRYLSTKALAEFHGVPKEYLSKALQALSQARLVETTLGPSGGYRLARPAAEINFRDIVEAVEGKVCTFACNNIRANNPCRAKDQKDKRPCAIARAMWKADAAWRDALAEIRLSDIMAEVVSDNTPELLEATAGWVAQHAG